MDLNRKLLKIDGGMVTNNWFSQFLADILSINVVLPKIHETTALGAAYMAGLQIGTYKSLDDISKNWRMAKKFTPKIKKKLRIMLLKGWLQAIKKTLA